MILGCHQAAFSLQINCMLFEILRLVFERVIVANKSNLAM